MINAVDPALTATATDSALFDGLGGEGFLTLLIAQLQYQDPLAPTDPSSMLEQTSQFANVEAIQKLNTLQTQTLGFTQFQAATAMLGQEVTYLDAELNETRTGTVTAVDATSTGPRLQLAGGTAIELTRVTGVTSVATAATTEPPTAAEPDALTAASQPATTAQRSTQP